MTDASMIWEELQRLEAENRALRQQIAQIKAIVKASSERIRMVYPPGPWWCVTCGKKTERPRWGLCPACYMRWYRRQKPRPLGGLVTRGYSI